MIYKTYRLYYLIAAVIFLFGLNIPKISPGAVIFVCIILAVNFVKNRKSIIHNFMVHFFWLLTFCVGYYLLEYSYGFLGLQQSIQYLIVILCCYALGYSLNKSNVPNWPNGLVLIFLCMASGFVLFSFLCTYNVSSHIGLFKMTQRVVRNFWIDGAPTHGQTLSIYSALGICLLPVLFYGKIFSNLNRKTSLALVFVVIILFLTAVYVNIILQNRSPFFLVSVCFIFLSFLYFRVRAGVKVKLRVKPFLFIIIVVLLTTIFIKSYLSIFYELPIYERFIKEGFSTPRFEIWYNMLCSIFDFPMGGRDSRINLLRTSYAHNIWLDTAFDVGLIPFLLLLIFHWKQFSSLVRVVFSIYTPAILSCCLICIFGAILMAFMASPVMQGSHLYFSATCFFFGICTRLSFDYSLAINSKNKRTNDR